MDTPETHIQVEHGTRSASEYDPLAGKSTQDRAAESMAALKSSHQCGLWVSIGKGAVLVALIAAILFVVVDTNKDVNSSHGRMVDSRTGKVLATSDAMDRVVLSENSDIFSWSIPRLEAIQKFFMKIDESAIQMTVTGFTKDSSSIRLFSGESGANVLTFFSNRSVVLEMGIGHAPAQPGGGAASTTKRRLLSSHDEYNMDIELTLNPAESGDTAPTFPPGHYTSDGQVSWGDSHAGTGNNQKGKGSNNANGNGVGNGNGNGGCKPFMCKDDLATCPGCYTSQYRSPSGNDPFPLQHESKCETWIYNYELLQGSYYLSNPGYYCLAEDIEFNPNSLASLGGAASPWDSSDPLPPLLGTKYRPRDFFIGFFAAFIINGSDITFDLRGHTISQSVEHALQQRFFADIELASAPFLSPQGPHSFFPLEAAQRVHITRGTLGRASHHGIHGNDARDITLSHLTFRDFEVAAISLNAVEGLEVYDCHAIHNRQDIPVIHTYSNGRFLRPYLNFLESSGSPTTLTVNGAAKNIAMIKSELKAALANVFEDVVTKQMFTVDKVAHPEEYALFANPEGLIDGGAYGFLLNQRGVAVRDFPDLQTTRTNGQSKRIRLAKVSMNNIGAAAHDRPVIVDPVTGIPNRDPVGATMQTLRKHPDPPHDFITLSNEPNFGDNRYAGNAVMNAQVFVCKAAQNGEFAASFLNTMRCSLSQKTLDWIESPPTDPASKLSSLGKFQCNLDSMNHINKGVVVYKFDGAAFLNASCLVSCGVKNTGASGRRFIELTDNDLCLDDPTIIPANISPNGMDIRRSAEILGIGVSGSEYQSIDNVKIADLNTKFGRGAGVCVQGDSENILLSGVQIDIDPLAVALKDDWKVL